jgi:hypothetical protein
MFHGFPFFGWGKVSCAPYRLFNWVEHEGWRQTFRNREQEVNQMAQSGR